MGDHRKSHCQRGHEMTPANTITRNESPTSRECRICHNARKRTEAYRAKRRKPKS